jgi:hypothetical protein
VLSGRSYPARLVGTDHSHGLSLLQIAGGPAFRPVAVGNSRYLSRGAAVTAVGSAGLTKTFTLEIGNLTSGTGVLAAGGQRFAGLLVSTARVVAGEETGGSRRGQADPGRAFALSRTAPPWPICRPRTHSQPLAGAGRPCGPAPASGGPGCRANARETCFRDNASVSSPHRSAKAVTTA